MTSSACPILRPLFCLCTPDTLQTWNLWSKQMTIMELRRRVIPPKRYEPELSDGERYMPTVRKALFRPRYVDFNPHLPPAAFPTLDEPGRTLSELDLGTELGEPCQQLLPTQSESTARGLGSLQQGSRSSHSLATPFVAMESHTWNAGIYPHNPEYYDSLASLQSGLSQEDFEWNMQEMETSDEDENNRQPRTAFIKASQRNIIIPPKLTNISAALISPDTSPAMEKTCSHSSHRNHPKSTSRRQNRGASNGCSWSIYRGVAGHCGMGSSSP